MTAPHQLGPTPGAATCEGFVAELKPHMAELQTLREQSIETLTPAVQDLVRSGSRDVRRIEHTLDQLLDIACLPAGLTLFKTLCHHYWTLDSQATASYIHAFREMWDADDQSDADEGAQ